MDYLTFISMDIEPSIIYASMHLLVAVDHGSHSPVTTSPTPLVLG
jgi:hypothetical protein